MSSIESIKKKIEALMGDLEKNMAHRDYNPSFIAYLPSPFENPWPRTGCDDDRLSETDRGSWETGTDASVERIQTELEKAVEHNKMLLFRLSEMKKAAGYDARIIAQLKGEIKELQTPQKKSSHTSEEIEELQKEINCLREKESALERALSEKDTMLSSSSNNEKTTQKLLSKKDNEVYELTRSTSEFLNKALKDQESQLTEMSDRNAHLLYDKKMLQKELKELKNALENEKTIISENEADLKEMQEQYMRMEEQLHEKDNEIRRLYDVHTKQNEKLAELEKPWEQESAAASESAENTNSSHGKVNKFIDWLKRPVIEIKEEEPEE